MDPVNCTYQKGGRTTAQEKVQEGWSRRGRLRHHLSRFSISRKPIFENIPCLRYSWPEAEIDLDIASARVCLAVTYEEL